MKTRSNSVRTRRNVVIINVHVITSDKKCKLFCNLYESINEISAGAKSVGKKYFKTTSSSVLTESDRNDVCSDQIEHVSACSRWIYRTCGTVIPQPRSRLPPEMHSTDAAVNQKKPRQVEQINDGSACVCVRGHPCLVKLCAAGRSDYDH